jgi:uncharacterized protein
VHRTLVVFAKEPVVGKVKTRLCPPCTLEMAAVLYQAFVGDTLRLCQRVVCEQRVLAWSADEYPRWLNERAGEDWELVDQGPGDLGDRMDRITRLYSSDGPVVLIGSDSPTVPPGHIAQAFDSLTDHDVVLGPSVDGGYWLVGVHKPVSGMFSGIDWSTERVFSQTAVKLNEAAANWTQVPEWYDIDEIATLRAWLDGRLPTGYRAPETATIARNMEIPI